MTGAALVPVEIASGGAVAAARETEPLLTGIARLKAEQAALRAERKRVQKELKNAEKRRVRLKKRARQLSDADLVAVLQMRETASSSGAASSGGAAASSAGHGAPGAAAELVDGA